MKRSDCSIIILALSRTESQYSSTALCLAREFAGDSQVIYINHPYTMKEFFLNYRKSQRLRRLGSELIKGKAIVEPTDNPNHYSVIPPLSIPVNQIPPSYLYNFLSHLNNLMIQRVIRHMIKRFSIREYILLNIHNPYFSGYINNKKFDPVMNIYLSVDDLSQDEYAAKHGIELEKILVSKSDLVLTTSIQLKRKLELFNPNTRLLNNGVDFSLFNQTLSADLPDPAMPKGIRKPIIGYTGNIDDTRLDFELLVKVAKANPDKSILLVGPIHSHEYYSLEIDKIDNVFWVGPKKIEALPGYLKIMDLVLIPFKLNTLTASIYPLKINEYLAAGKTVIATNFSLDIAQFKDVIKIAGSHHDFLMKVEQSLKGKPPSAETIQKRVAEAKSNSWESRVEQFWKYVEAAFD